MRNRTLLGPYSRPKPRALGGVAVSYERGSPVGWGCARPLLSELVLSRRPSSGEAVERSGCGGPGLFEGGSEAMAYSSLCEEVLSHAHLSHAN